MKVDERAIAALCDELEKRSKKVMEFSKKADTLNEQLRFVGYSEACEQLSEELKKRGELVAWE